MPQRIIKPVYEHMTSPLTVRAFLLFVAVVFLAYTVIADWQQRQASAERYKAIVQYTEESRAALLSAKQQGENSEALMRNSQAMLVFTQEMTRSMHEVAEILKHQQKEHAAILNGGTVTSKVKKPPRKRTATVKPKKECFRFVPKTKKIGNNEVIVHEGISIPCE